MINLIKNVIRISGQDYPITDFKVWWFVEGHGITDNIQEALATGLPILPQSVAIADGIYEVLSQQDRHLHSQASTNEVSGDSGS